MLLLNLFDILTVLYYIDILTVLYYIFPVLYYYYDTSDNVTHSLYQIIIFFNFKSTLVTWIICDIIHNVNKKLIFIISTTIMLTSLKHLITVLVMILLDRF